MAVRTINVRYTREMARQAYRYQLFGHNRLISFGRREGTMAVVVLSIAVFLQFSDMERWGLFLAGGFALIVMASFAVALLPYLAGLISLQWTFRGRDHIDLTVLMDDHGVRVRAPEGEFGLPWDEIKHVQHQPGFWLLQGAEGDLVVLPLENLDTDVRQRIEQAMAGRG